VARCFDCSSCLQYSCVNFPNIEPRKTTFILVTNQVRKTTIFDWSEWNWISIFSVPKSGFQFYFQILSKICFKLFQYGMWTILRQILFGDTKKMKLISLKASQSNISFMLRLLSDYKDPKNQHPNLGWPWSLSIIIFCQ